MDKQQQTRLRILLEGYSRRILKPDEMTELLGLLELPGAEQQWEVFFMEEMEQADPDSNVEKANWDKIWQKVQTAKEIKATKSTNKAKENPVPSAVRVFLRSRGFQAAAVLVLVICGAYLLTTINHQEVHYHPKQKTAKVIVHGKQGAILHLMSGRTIDLSEEKDGVIAQEHGVRIIKRGGSLYYEGGGTQNIYNRITTNRGRQWKLTLPDGSIVWLNAASEIKFPLTFSGKDRLVYMKGEAYFEVMHDAARPFKVNVNGQLIEDLGTAFNVNAYPDEKVTRTTLISGSILLKFKEHSVVMKPGEQATVHRQIKLKTLQHPLSAIAWKSGMFHFENTELSAIMRQLARWYNVEVVYQENSGERHFTGNIPRNMLITDVLKILEKAGAHFKVESLPGEERDGRITVSR